MKRGIKILLGVIISIIFLVIIFIVLTKSGLIFNLFFKEDKIKCVYNYPGTENKDEYVFIFNKEGFLTRYIDDLLSTIISRSQCFFVPTNDIKNQDYSIIAGVFENYWNFERSGFKYYKAQ